MPIQEDTVPLYKYATKCATGEVLLLFVTTVVSIVGIPLTVLSIILLVWKMTEYTHFMDIKADAVFFSLPAGLLCIPSIFLTWLIKKYRFRQMILFVCFQVIAIIVLFTGYFIGMIYQLHYTNETLHLGSTIPTEPLNRSLNSIITTLERNSSNYDAMTEFDWIQFKFTCCGIESADDFTEIPQSCCPNVDCSNNEVYARGCLRRIQEVVAWNQNLTLSVTQILILMYFFHWAMVTTIFVSDHYKWCEYPHLTRRRERQNR